MPGLVEQEQEQQPPQQQHPTLQQVAVLIIGAGETVPPPASPCRRRCVGPSHDSLNRADGPTTAFRQHRARPRSGPRKGNCLIVLCPLLRRGVGYPPFYFISALCSPLNR